MATTTFVTIDGTNGFWMQDRILELWLRLLALHIAESPDEGFLGRTVRDQWLLASKGYFNGHVPHDLETFAIAPNGQQIIRNAIASLMSKLKHAPSLLDGPTLDLLGIDDRFVDPVDTHKLIEVGDAFQQLLDGKITSDATSTEFMPGT